jgi:ribosomal protein S24E
MSDFRKLQAILDVHYEQLATHTHSPLRAFLSESTESKEGSADMSTIKADIGGQITNAISKVFSSKAESEEENVTGTIDKKHVLSLIDTAIADAQNNEMNYCAFILSKLRKEIKQ